jgi:hypothetical protein
MRESGVREELQSLKIRVQGVMQLRSGRRDQDPAKDRLLTPHFIVSVARGPEVASVITYRALRFVNDSGVVRGAKGPTAVQPLPPLWIYTA